MGRTIGQRAGSAQPTGHRRSTYAAPADVPIPAPQFGNSPASGRPPAEHAPGGWSATTAPGQSTRPAVDADRGDRSPADVSQSVISLCVLGADYLNRGLPTPAYLAEPFDEVTDTEFLADKDRCPASLPIAGGQADPSPRPSRSSVEQLRWVRCPDDKHLHLLHPADEATIDAGDHAPAVCGQRISADGLTITRDPSGALCMTCVVGATSPPSDLGPRGTS